MEIKSDILAMCDKKIETMKNTQCPEWVKEETIKERKISKQVLEVICGTHGISASAAIHILNEAKEIIQEVAMTQII